MCRAQVLTTGSWPTQMAARCSLPLELEACCEEFRAFYLASHSGRKLSWQTNMGNAGARPCALIFVHAWDLGGEAGRQHPSH